jgi:hypothetical protein
LHAVALSPRSPEIPFKSLILPLRRLTPNRRRRFLGVSWQIIWRSFGAQTKTQRHAHKKNDAAAQSVLGVGHLFNKVVTSCHPDHFVQSDWPLIVSYVQATLIARRYAKGKLKDPKHWSAAIRVQTMLARSLRLAPHSRSGPKAVAHRAPNFSVYDLME